MPLPNIHKYDVVLVEDVLFLFFCTQVRWRLAPSMGGQADFVEASKYETFNSTKSQRVRKEMKVNEENIFDENFPCLLAAFKFKSNSSNEFWGII